MPALVGRISRSQSDIQLVIRFIRVLQRILFWLSAIQCAAACFSPSIRLWLATAPRELTLALVAALIACMVGIALALEYTYRQAVVRLAEFRDPALARDLLDAYATLPAPDRKVVGSVLLELLPALGAKEAASVASDRRSVEWALRLADTNLATAIRGTVQRASGSPNGQG